MSFASFLKRSPALHMSVVYGALFAVGLALASLLVINRTASLVDDTMDAYGTTVSSQLAHTTLDAVMQRDMIALQAHLARLMKTPGIVSAVIYDVEHRLLAQAGATPSELVGRRYLHNYTTTLSLGDNVQGNVVVTIDTAAIEESLPQARRVLAVGFVVVLLLVVLASRHFAEDIQRQRSALSRALRESIPPGVIPADDVADLDLSSDEAIRHILQQLREHVEQVQAPSPAALREAAAALLNSEGGRAYLLLECRNLDLLQRQVSRERLRLLLGRMQQQVEKTCRLYHAQRVPVAGSCIKMVIPSASGQMGDALLQAAFLAQVLAGVLSQCRDEELGIQLQWSLALDWHPPCDNDILRNRQQAQDDQRSAWLCRQVGAGEMAVSAEAGTLLQEQDKMTLAVDHGEGGKPFYRITGVVHTQRQLLEGQIAHLLADG